MPCALVAGGPGIVDRVLARAARLPRPPVPLPVPPAPERWRIGFGEPLHVAHQGPDAAEDPALVLELVDDVRARLQEKVLRQPRQPKGSLVMAAEFNSPKEFREVMDRIFEMMDTDPDMGPKLRAADVPQRFEFSDVDMVVNIRAATEGEERQPALGVERRRRLGAQGQDDHVARRRPTSTSRARRTSPSRSPGGGSRPAATSRRRSSLIPITKPVYARYTEVVEAEYPHLKV